MAVIIIVAVAIAALACIVVAPWRGVRDEPALPPAIQARLLGGDAPSDVAVELDSRPDHPRTPRAATGSYPRLDPPGGKAVPPRAG
ncbi:MAG: hypothetical protein FJW88_12990 [Actinobacteria bacterium]|nr:hypothetical protein [Actinomycetota bacterium]